MGDSEALSVEDIQYLAKRLEQELLVLANENKALRIRVQALEAKLTELTRNPHYQEMYGE